MTEAPETERMPLKRPKLRIHVMHLAGVPERVETCKKLMERSASAYPVYDAVGRGAWDTARRCWEMGIDSGADWIVVLNDDALPVPGFDTIAAEALAHRSPRDPVCFYAADERTKEARDEGYAWTTTHDAFLGVGCALSREAAIAFLEWHDASMSEEYTDDGRVQLWAMATGRLIYTAGLVDHQLPDVSTVGNERHDCRTAAFVEDGRADWCEPDWSKPAKYIGRHFEKNHWELAFRTTPTAWDIEAMYTAERFGEPVNDKPHVLIATPAYAGPKLAYLRSVALTIADLQRHGFEVTHLMNSGDSLVTRGRHHLCHEFLSSRANHLLQWDADVECMDETAVRKMIETGHPIIGGAYPWRDGSGRVVVNPLQGPGKHSIKISDGCVKVAEVGTGFLLVQRRVLVDLMMRHPELLYQSDFPDTDGHPIWALFDARLERMANGRQRYASEDWGFCSLARAAGYEVNVYLPPVFRHWGEKGHEGHVTTAWSMSAGRKVEEAAE